MCAVSCSCRRIAQWLRALASRLAVGGDGRSQTRSATQLARELRALCRSAQRSGHRRARRRRRRLRRRRATAEFSLVVAAAAAAAMASSDPARAAVLAEYRKTLLQHKEVDAKVRAMREETKTVKAQYDKTEDDLKALQSVGQIIGEVLKTLDEERVIVKASSGPRYVVGCRNKIDKAKLLQGTRVSLDMTTLTIMRLLPREVDPTVHQMKAEDPGDIQYSSVGGLNEQIRELREVIELPLINPELFQRVGIKAPKGVLLYGPPGTGKTLLARAVANNIDASFLKVVASAIVDKYIGESARLIREMFG